MGERHHRTLVGFVRARIRSRGYGSAMTAMEGERSRTYEVPIIWRRAFWAWVAMAVAMSANGVFRELVLTPRFGERM
jgi:hypothetical protein